MLIHYHLATLGQYLEFRPNLTSFCATRDSKLRKDKLIFKKLADKIEIVLKPIKLPREVLLCFVKTRTYVTVRIINRKIAIENRFKTKKKS